MYVCGLQPVIINIFSGVVPARYILAILGSIGMAIVYGLKVNLSVAMVGMVNHTANRHVSTSHTGANHTSDLECQPTDGSSKTKVIRIVSKCYFFFSIV